MACCIWPWIHAGRLISRSSRFAATCSRRWLRNRVLAGGAVAWSLFGAVHLEQHGRSILGRGHGRSFGLARGVCLVPNRESLVSDRHARCLGLGRDVLLRSAGQRLAGERTSVEFSISWRPLAHRRNGGPGGQLLVAWVLMIWRDRNSFPISRERQICFAAINR